MAVKNYKVPIRKCVGCMEQSGKKELIRIVRTKEGEEYKISLDATGKMSGRGAYICKDAKCLATARKKKSLSRALNCEIPEEIYEKLDTEFRSL